MFQSVIAESLKELTNKCLSVFRKNIERKNNERKNIERKNIERKNIERKNNERKNIERTNNADIAPWSLSCSAFPFFSCKLVSNPTKTLPRICPIFVSVARHRKRMVEQTVELNIFKDRATYFQGLSNIFEIIDKHF